MEDIKCINGNPVMIPLNVPKKYVKGKMYRIILGDTVIRTMMCVHSDMSMWDKCHDCPNFSDIEASICGSCSNDNMKFISVENLMEDI